MRAQPLLRNGEINWAIRARDYSLTSCPKFVGNLNPWEADFNDDIRNESSRALIHGQVDVDLFPWEANNLPTGINKPTRIENMNLKKFSIHRNRRKEYRQLQPITDSWFDIL